MVFCTIENGPLGTENRLDFLYLEEVRKITPPTPAHSCSGFVARWPMPRKNPKLGEAAPRLPHANDIEFLAAFKGFVEACESKSISEKTYRAQLASECYSRHMDLVINQIDAGVFSPSDVKPQWIKKKWTGQGKTDWTPQLSKTHRAATAMDMATALVAACRKVHIPAYHKFLTAKPKPK